MLEVVELVKLGKAVVVQHDAVTATERKRGSAPARPPCPEGEGDSLLLVPSL